MNFKKYEYWFIVGSQDLYGEETLKQVEQHARIMVDDFNKSGLLPNLMVLKPLAKSPSGIKKLFEEANACANCAGIITWMHTFSPSKMWIGGLAINHKPLLHLHTQFNRHIPWASIDMDFMNLNQSAHGDREHGYIHTRMAVNRKVVAGFWQDNELKGKIAQWMRVANARQDGLDQGVMRLGDNMREVAVTEGDKIEAQIKLGWQVNSWGIGNLAHHYNTIGDNEAEQLVAEYEKLYQFDSAIKKGNPAYKAVLEQAKIELALKIMLQQENAVAFTTTFQDLHGLSQLPGLAVQNLMAQGYGFGAEGDWKQAMLTRSAKVMAHGLKGGVSFMEDYTYHLEQGNEMALGSHMLEVCPSIAGGKPIVQVHPLGIGGKADPARLVFEAQPSPSVLVTLIDLGNRFRMILNEIETLPLPEPMPKLPVARALWKPYPNLATSAESWILAGGTHHSVYSSALTTDYFRDYAEMMGLELIVIDKETKIDQLKNILRWNNGVAKW